MIGRRRLEPDDPPPDLAIETDVTKTTLDAYLAIAVPEIWIYDSGKLTIYLLSNGQYIKSDISPTFPNVPLSEMIPATVERAWMVGSVQALEEFELAFASS